MCFFSYKLQFIRLENLRFEMHFEFYIYQHKQLTMLNPFDTDQLSPTMSLSAMLAVTLSAMSLLDTV